jgi:hypothetical protein
LVTVVARIEPFANGRIMPFGDGGCPNRAVCKRANYAVC